MENSERAKLVAIMAARKEALALFEKLDSIDKPPKKKIWGNFWKWLLVIAILVANFLAWSIDS